jgi:PIN domain nuclease of toxin-antitoxin system
MRLILDTHIFLWHISGDPKLPAKYRLAILDSSNEVYLSVASVWEAIVKYAIRKLHLPGPPATYLPHQRIAHQISSLPIDEESMAPLEGLPAIHRDPFDRMIIAQATHHGLTILTVDTVVFCVCRPDTPDQLRSFSAQCHRDLQSDEAGRDGG